MATSTRSSIPPLGVLGPLVLSVLYALGGMLMAIALYVMGFIFGAIANGIDHSDMPGASLFAILFGSSGTGLKVGCAIVLAISFVGLSVAVAAFRGKRWTRIVMSTGFVAAALLKIYLVAAVAQGGESAALVAAIILDFASVVGLSKNPDYFSS